MSNDNLEITWQASDGYVGGRRPQKLRIEHYEIFGCESADAAMVMIDEAIEADFRDKVNPEYDRDAIKAQVEEILKNKPTED